MQNEGAVFSKYDIQLQIPIHSMHTQIYTHYNLLLWCCKHKSQRGKSDYYLVLNGTTWRYPSHCNPNQLCFTHAILFYFFQCWRPVSWEIMCAALNNLEKEPTNATINNKSNSSSQSVLCTACCFGLSKNQPKPNTNYSISQNNPFLEDNNENDVYEIQDVSNNSKPKTSTSLSFPNSKSVAYSPESPSTTSCPTMSPKNTMPTQMGFLVSFLVDARGGAMQGNRGSGMRLIIPPGKI